MNSNSFASPLFLVPVLICLVYGVLTLAIPGTISGQEALSVRGRVINGTSGFSVPDDLAALMLITGPDGTLAVTGQAFVDADGGFVFEDVARVPEGVYTISVDYEGVFYGLSLDEENLGGENVITIFEPTEDAGIIVVDRQVMVITGFDISERMATVTEFVRFTNPTDRTLQANLETARPGMFSFMRFALPPDAANVTVQSDLRGGEVISVGTGFALTAAVPPGEHSVDFAYSFPYEDGRVSYRNSLPQGAGIFQILVPVRWEGIEISGVAPRQPVGIQDQVYRAWEGRDIPPGPGIDLEIERLPQPGVLARVGGTLSGGSFWLAAIPSAMGVALLALLVLGMARRYRTAIAGEGGRDPGMDDPGEAVSSQRVAIVAELASLDELHQQGGMMEEEYLRRRAILVDSALRESQSDDT